MDHESSVYQAGALIPAGLVPPDQLKYVVAYLQNGFTEEIMAANNHGAIPAHAAPHAPTGIMSWLDRR